ncbi:hypothetical protein EV193_11134 [Herbihabitans rhizosphaerae]|uniref:DUF4253 domain-containing protein n=1 Tax=Herbihabitans rhizosphaerae TaxID=1872711 RepID=A0A4Q7KID1_9PSEU|nr:hypothetical protein [Herbihabitans rhizosphaerae]RZS32658.1 hypothetical protein EV193_11134 [Herbihabitans rhizosphaerae]
MLTDLLAEIERQGDPAAVGLELFFDGNDDPASIGCNLDEHPGVGTFARVLRAVRDRPEVDDVLVGISEVMPDGEWPFSDTVHVLTAASAGDVAGWVAGLGPDDVAKAELNGRPAIALWWD